MAIDIRNLFLIVSKLIWELDSERMDSKQPLRFTDVKDGMLYLHTAWQDLLTKVRNKEDIQQIVLSTLNLASVAIKFSSDLGSTDTLDG